MGLGSGRWVGGGGGLRPIGSSSRLHARVLTALHLVLLLLLLLLPAWASRTMIVRRASDGGARAPRAVSASVDSSQPGSSPSTPLRRANARMFRRIGLDGCMRCSGATGLKSGAALRSRSTTVLHTGGPPHHGAPGCVKGTTGADATPASAPCACAAGRRQVGGRAGGS